MIKHVVCTRVRTQRKSKVDSFSFSKQITNLFVCILILWTEESKIIRMSLKSILQFVSIHKCKAFSVIVSTVFNLK